MSALREILAHFGVKFDSKELEHGHASIEHTLHSLEELGAAIGGSLIVEGIREFIERIVEASVNLEHMSVRTGIATDELQALEYAAGLSGVSVETLDTSLARLNRTLFEAKEGNKESAKAFAALGIHAGELKKLDSAGDILPELADKFAALKTPAERSALAMKLFGRGGVAMVPLLAKGAEGIRELTEEARALGGGLQEGAIKAGVEMEEQQKRLSFAMLGLKSRIAVSLLPALTYMVDKLVKGVVWMQKLAQGSNILQAMIALLGGSGLSAILRLLGGFKGLFVWLGRLLLRLAIPALLIDELITTFEGGDTIIRRIIDGWFGPGSTKKVVDWFKALFGKEDEFERKTRDTADQVERRFGKMARVMFEVFTYGIGAMTHGWDYFVKSLEDSWEGWKEFFGASGMWIESQFLSIVDSIRGAFVSMWNSIIDATAGAIDKLAGKLEAIPGAKKLLGKLSDTVEGAKGEETFRKGISFDAALSAAHDASPATLAQAMANFREGVANMPGGASAVAMAPPGRGAITPLYMKNETKVDIEVHGDGASQGTLEKVGRAASKGVIRGHRAALDAVSEQAEAD